MSTGADPGRRPDLPRQWERLERAVEDAAGAVEYWRRRAVETDEEVTRLRRTLEGLSGTEEQAADPSAELRRLRAENAALRSRMLQARKRVQLLMKRFASLGIEP
jgi:predicted RNase H-like nuclease (RuvC/YqgF family)